MAEIPYRSKELVSELAHALQEAAQGLPPLSLMHVCGTHEHEISRHALRQLLPKNVKVVAGPGCPVCITPASAIATAIKFATLNPPPILCTYGDIVRVPIGRGSLWQTKSRGAEVRVIYGPRDAVRMAEENPDRPVVFFSIGFETTAAPVASLLAAALPKNFLIYCCHRYVPAAVEALAADAESPISGYLLPGHASVISGYQAYAFLPERYQKPAAVAGFEPVDILAGILSLVRQIQQRRPTVANCYPRAVKPEGNRQAQQILEQVFDRTDAAWRGIGILPGTGLELREPFRRWSALAHYGLEEEAEDDILPGCSCHLIMTGRRQPSECGLFGKACTPENPKGPCMVGGEGTCRAHYLYPEPEDV